MKLCIPIQIKPEGGGNYFLLNFLRYLDRAGITYTSRVKDRHDVLFTSHWLVPLRTIRQALRACPDLRLVHRIDGAGQDYGRDARVDAEQQRINDLADLTIFQSRYCRWSTRERFHVIGHDGPVIHNPVDIERFTPEGPRRSFRARVNVCCVTWSTNPMKGAWSVYAVARANPDVGFILCGRFPDAPALPNLELMGVLDREALAGVMRSCDALLTFAEREACPNIVLEGLASGLPVLYKVSGATPELVADCGLPVEPETFRQQLERVLAEREIYARRARVRAVAEFSPERVFTRYLAAIEEALRLPQREKRIARGLRRAVRMPSELAGVHLVVFMTWGMSLRQWDRSGILERELALYRRLRPQLGRISFVTYGGPEELTYEPSLEGMRVLCNRWRLPFVLYGWLLPLLYRHEFRTAHVLKTNQAHGAEVLQWVKRFHAQAKAVIRCGYLWSLNARRAAQGRWSREVVRATRCERAVFAAADRIVVTTELVRQEVQSRYGIAQERIRIVPNYVDTELFRREHPREISGRQVLFVGRLHEEKNLLALVEAMRGIDAELVLVGDGPLRFALERAALAGGAHLTLLGSRAHHELPTLFAAADCFILPSRYENHPKALLEAMSFGLPVIGTDVPGIRELIEHRNTGYLCGTTPEAIRHAIDEVLSDVGLRERMGRQASAFVKERFSLQHVETQERALLNELLRRSDVHHDLVEEAGRAPQGAGIAVLEEVR